MSRFSLNEAYARKTGEGIEVSFYGRVEVPELLLSLRSDQKLLDAEIYMFMDPRFDVSHPSGRVIRVLVPDADHDLQIFADETEDQRITAADLQDLLKKGPFRIRIIEKNTDRDRVSIRGSVFAGAKTPVRIELAEADDEDDLPDNSTASSEILLPEISRFEDPFVSLHFALAHPELCGFAFQTEKSRIPKTSLVFETEDDSLQIPLSDLLQDGSRENLSGSLKKGFSYIRQFGLKKTLSKALKKGTEKISSLSYHNYALSLEPSERDLERQRKARFEYSPLISIVMAAYNTPLEYLSGMMQSLLSQSYENWELCLADASDSDEVQRWIESHPDPRIRYRKLKENAGIAQNTNAALKMAAGDYIGFMDHDDLLRADCFYQIVLALQKKRFDMIYTDEDKLISETGRYAEPHYKPNFSLDLLRSENYITHFLIVSSDLAERTGELNGAFNGSQDYDYILRASEQAAGIGHIPQVLYHWRAHADSTALHSESKMYCFENGKRALEDHLKRSGVLAGVSMLPAPYYGKYRIQYRLHPDTLVSVILTGSVSAQTLSRLAVNLSGRNPDLSFELLIPFEYDGRLSDSLAAAGCRQLEKNGTLRTCCLSREASLAESLNHAAMQAKGDLLFFLDPALHIREQDSVCELAALAFQPHIGAVSGKIIDDHSLVAASGLVLRPKARRPFAGAFGGLEYFHPGYQGRALVVSDFSLLPLSALMLERRLFFEAGGFAYQASESLIAPMLCMRLLRMGRWNAADPFALFEAPAGWRMKEKQFSGELPEEFTRNDPFYNPNFSDAQDAFQIPVL